MEFNAQNGQARPQSTQQPAPQPAAPRNTPAAPAPKKSGKLTSLIVTALLLLAVIAAGLYIWKSSHSGDSAVDNGKFQAVFLTNGQVYFGKLDSLKGDYLELSNVYYLQVQQTVQPAKEENAEDKSQVSLTKLGKELHGPTDKMNIKADQVLFWEDLKDDSTVVKAIKNFESQ